jgi:N-acetylated-alpha-linked acidic dipeptidase
MSGLARIRVVLAMMILSAAGLSMQENPPAKLSGFSQAGSARERAIEEQFLKVPSPDEARKWHRYFTAEPHPAGSERNNDLARYVADSWKNQGWEDIKMHRYDVLVSLPRQVAVELVSPVKYQASLREEPYDADPDTANPAVRSAYLGLSASGDVTAPIVYAHSGNPEDYEVLRKHGIDVKGKIVLVRYSNPYSYRGFKALTAQKLGAAALLIYSDPAEDGFVRGKVFPDGPWGPESHIQRGAITYDFMVPGDPLTPGWASVPGAKHVPMEEAISLPKIIAVPLSWHDAKPILENMGGPVAPPSWQGGLKLKYRLGNGEAQVHVRADMDTHVGQNYVVEARLRGSEAPDQWILLGNHRDAWEFGGVDPSSGTASMMELTRALGELKKQGIGPKRTLIACSWDGEEVGLTGSTEWGEQFADDLKQKLVAYVNVDSSASGPNFQPTAVGSLAPLLVEVSHSLALPSGKLLYDEWKSQTQAALRRSGTKRPVLDSDLVDTRIGSGSDHTVFLNFLGRPTVGLTFDGPYGVYHSVYDDFYWMNQFGDPGYKYHTLLTQIWGVLALRMANADVLPFDFGYYARTIRQFVDEIAAGKDARRRVDFGGAVLQTAEFEKAGDSLRQLTESALSSGSMTAERAREINRLLIKVEGNWLNPDGIPGRPWFKHMLYAARYTYAHLELPGVAEAVEKQDWDTARRQLSLIERALAKNTRLLRDAAGSPE